jgi:GDP-4-dehydro-6-deoxy-D-mannose reductase
MTFIEQLMSVRDRRGDSIKVGNTAQRRDFVDVRDIVTAFDALISKGVPGEVYNIGSGEDVAVQEIIDRLMEISGIRVSVETASSRMRPVDVACVRASIAKITTQTGWRPTIPLDRSLQEMWEHSGSA